MFQKVAILMKQNLINIRDSSKIQKDMILFNNFKHFYRVNIDIQIL